MQAASALLDDHQAFHVVVAVDHGPVGRVPGVHRELLSSQRLQAGHLPMVTAGEVRQPRVGVKRRYPLHVVEEGHVTVVHDACRGLGEVRGVVVDAAGREGVWKS